MTPLEVALIIILIAGAFAFLIYASTMKTPSPHVSKGSEKPSGRRAMMTDRECQKEYEEHKPSVSASVLSKLKKIQRLYLGDEGVIQFQNIAGVDTGQGYSLRVRVKKGESYRIICFSYNTHGKFYSIQDTGGKGGHMGEKGDFICSY
jgi:hypothetical protein